MIDEQLVAAVSAGLLQVADPDRAPAMQAYMKSEMPYLGVPAPLREKVFRRIFADHPLSEPDDWRHTVLALWRGAAYREERYAAITLTGHRFYGELQTPDALPMYEELVVTGAWWDYVDTIGINRVGPMLLERPDVLRPLMLAWSTDGDLWRRRTSIICQVGARDRIDLGLLYACIEPNLGDPEFFIRKAIGWALRQHAWLDPDEVERYVATRDDRLSGLSRREALKNLPKIRAGRATTSRRQ